MTGRTTRFRFPFGRVSLLFSIRLQTCCGFHQSSPTGTTSCSRRVIAHEPAADCWHRWIIYGVTPPHPHTSSLTTWTAVSERTTEAVHLPTGYAAAANVREGSVSRVYTDRTPTDLVRRLVRTDPLFCRPQAVSQLEVAQGILHSDRSWMALT